MSQIIDLDDLGDRERAILQAHINEINEAYVKSIDELVEGQEERLQKLDVFHKRSTWLVWMMFWISGFLMRGLFIDTNPEWHIASLIAGIAFGGGCYISVYYFLFNKKD